MRSIIIKVLVNGAALWAAAYVLSGIHLAEGGESLRNKLLTILLVAVIFGLLNALIKPVVTLFSLPFIVLTLGLFTLVINALMLELTSWLAGELNIAFQVDHFFWDAILGAIIITVVSIILGMVLPDDDR